MYSKEELEKLEKISSNLDTIRYLEKERDEILNNFAENSTKKVEAAKEDCYKGQKKIQKSFQITSPIIPTAIRTVSEDEGLDSFEAVLDWIYYNGELISSEESERFIESVKESDLKYADYKQSLDNVRVNFERDVREKRNTSKADMKKKTAEISKKIDLLKKECVEMNILHEDYLDFTNDIISILKTRRADNITDALNIAIKEKKESEYRAELIIRHIESLADRIGMMSGQVQERKYDDVEIYENEKMIQDSYFEKRSIQNKMLAEAQKTNHILEQQRDDAKRAADKDARDAQAAARRREYERTMLQSQLDSVTSQYYSYKKQGLLQDAARCEAEIKRIQGKLMSL